MSLVSELSLTPPDLTETGQIDQSDTMQWNNTRQCGPSDQFQHSLISMEDQCHFGQCATHHIFLLPLVDLVVNYIKYGCIKNRIAGGLGYLWSYSDQFQYGS